MRRAVWLVAVLGVVGIALGVWLDLLQTQTARDYLDGCSVVREHLLQNELEEAAHEQAYLHAKWQHDVTWLNLFISHHHTRAVGSAMLELATALEQRWRDEALRALDKVTDALGEIESSDSATLENVL